MHSTERGAHFSGSKAWHWAKKNGRKCARQTYFNKRRKHNKRKEQIPPTPCLSPSLWMEQCSRRSRSGWERSIITGSSRIAPRSSEEGCTCGHDPTCFDLRSEILDAKRTVSEHHHHHRQHRGSSRSLGQETENVHSWLVHRASLRKTRPAYGKCVGK